MSDQVETATQPHFEPQFEPLGLFDFVDPVESNQDEPESSTTITVQKRTVTGDGGKSEDLLAELAMMESERATQKTWMDSAPEMPDFEEEPEDLDMEEELPANKTSAISNVASTQTIPKRSEAPSLGSMTFGESNILDFERPIASSSRVTYTPAPESLPLAVEMGRCTLPPLSAETASGSIISFNRRNKLKTTSAIDDLDRNSVGTVDLLSEPLHHLKFEVQEMRMKERNMKAQQKKEREARQVKITTTSSMTMWVDKYRPKQFTDLLGEERVHRDVMGWLKEWDKCVFKRANPPKKRRYNEEEEEEVYFDSLGRPRERILLLSGPPGYGKTTLAHVVAKQAGYKTLEINASDDRNAGTVTTRIKNALDAGSGLNSDRPTCVIIDEIDGASGGGDASFVKSLIKLIQDIPARKKSNTPARPLRRPIICICNDLYAASLRPLRPFARIVRFKKPQAQFLVKRLREICERETLTADLRVLTTLVEITTGDVRSCLNTLQFIKSKSTIVTDDAIKSSAVGLKDSGTTLQSTWNSLFIPISAKTRRKQSGIDNGKYVKRLIDTVFSCGDYDKLLMGLFEHYPNLKPLDASLGNLTKLHDWLAYYDRVSGRVNESQVFELMGYLPYAIVPWYSHLAAPANTTKPTEWPKADYECYQARTVNEEVSTSFKSAIPPILRSMFTSSTAITELIPLLMRIITPPLKPVNANIVKSGERAVLERLVELLIPLGLSFWQEKSESGQPMMRLEPPIDVFIHYDGKRADDIVASRFAVRQLVAQAMDAEVARRRGGAETVATTGAAQYKGAYGAAKKGQMKKPDTGDGEVIATDFFGRVLVKTLPVDVEVDDVFTESAPVQPNKKFKAVYKFHEGSSSAVRKNIKMSALM